VTGFDNAHVHGSHQCFGMIEENAITGRDAMLRMLSAIEDLCGDKAELAESRAMLTRVALRAYLTNANETARARCQSESRIECRQRL